MANDLNQCNFIGRLGKDPEQKATPGGAVITTIDIAVGEQWKDKQSGDKQEKTTWVRCVAFGKLAEIMGKYLKKGSQVYVSGKFSVRKWQGVDEKINYSTEVVVNSMQMLGDKKEYTPGQDKPAQQNASQGFDDFDDDLPNF